MSARLLPLLALAALASASLLAAPAPAQSDRGVIPVIELSDEISPATSAWIGSALDAAAEEGATAAIIRLDTPGGLDTSMREIVKDIIAAPMPVVVYVAPSGARAASAGVFITEAADVAAMAPETNIGSASPISATGEDLGETLGRKVTNDASAFVRSLATSHGRNAELAERMVRQATNVTAEEALDAGLIDLVAADEEELLQKLDGYRVKGPKTATLATAGMHLDERGMPLQYDLLSFLVDPNVAFLLLLVGLVGIALEVFSPGGVIPGAVGAVSLLLGLFGTLQLPVEAIGFVLLAAGFALIVAEAHLPTGGLLGVAGVGALIGAGLLLFDGEDGVEVDPVLVVVVAVLLGGAAVLVGQRALAARRRPVATGEEELIGAVGEVRQAIDPIGQVFVGGALWRARAAGGEPIGVGYRVRVEAIDGLTLSVLPLERGEPVASPAATRTEGS